MKMIKLLLIVSISFNFSCDLDSDSNSYFENNCIDGHGAIVSESRVLNDFNSINSNIYGDILITQGPLENVIIEAHQNILDEIETNVVNGELIITLNHCIDIVEPVKVHITIPNIQNLTLTGVGGFIFQNDFILTNINVSLTGAGDFTLLGTANNVDILLTGVGDIKAFGLISEVCNITITGIGDTEVFVNDELNVTITGVGNVYYKGNPSSINSNITGTGSVINTN